MAVKDVKKQTQSTSVQAFLEEAPAFDDKQLEQLERAAKSKQAAHLNKIKPSAGQLYLPKQYLSYSQIEMYLRCARQYKFRYVENETQPPGIAMTLGSGAHHACEVTHHHLVDHGEPAPTAQVVDAFSDTFETRAEAIPETAWQVEKADRGSIKDVGVRLVSLYNNKVAPHVRPQVKAGVRGIEKKFKVDVNGIPMVGVIDLIDTNDPAGASEVETQVLKKGGQTVPETLRTAVADLKTKSKAMSQAEVDGSLQLTLYSFVEGVPLVRYDQLLNQKTLRVKRIHSTRTLHDHGWMAEVVTSVANAISLGVFPPCSPTAWVCCAKWCGYYHLCRGKVR